MIRKVGKKNYAGCVAPGAQPHTIGMIVDLNARYVRPHTAQVNQAVLRHLVEVAGEVPLLTAITEGLVRRLARHLMSEVSPSSAVTYLQRLHALIGFAVSHHYMSHNPMPPISKLLPPVPSRSKHPLTLRQIRRLESVPIAHESTRRAFFFSIYTGLRLSDVETLRWGDISCHNGVWVLCKEQVKTRSSIEIILTRQALQILDLERGGADLPVSGRVFADLMSRTTISKDLEGWKERAGLDIDLTFHVARHTFASLLYSTGASMADVSVLCGHKSLLTTERYIHSFVDSRRQVMIRMEGMLEGVGASPHPAQRSLMTRLWGSVTHKCNKVMCKLLKMNINAFGLQNY